MTKKNTRISDAQLSITNVEILAKWISELLFRLGIHDTFKSYDPLTIEETEEWYIAHTYCFDMEWWWRHHKRDSLQQILEEIINSAYEDILDSFNTDD